jgi:hypothetical protein
MPKGSDGRLVRVGLVGPKPRQRCVGDGQTVNIPSPILGSEAVTRCVGVIALLDWRAYAHIMLNNDQKSG